MSQNNLETANNIIYELTQKNEQIDFLINENSQYSQLIYNLQSEIFSLKNKINHYKNISNQLKLSQEKNIQLENKIKLLSNEIISLVKKSKEEKRESDNKFYEEISKLKYENEGFKTKIDIANSLAYEKNGLMNAFDTVVKTKNEILLEQEKKLRENKINSQIKLANLKKKMLQTVNNTQQKMNELNTEYVDASTKLAMLQNQQMIIKNQYQIKIIQELQNKNNLLEKENFELKKDLEIHKGVELSLAEKFKKLKTNKEIKNINIISYDKNNIFRKKEKNLTEKNNNSITNIKLVDNNKKILSNLKNNFFNKKYKFI